MPTSPTELLGRITGRLAPLERARQHAYWAAATHARPETSDARAPKANYRRDLRAVRSDQPTPGRAGR